MEFCPNFISVDDDPVEWARAREAEGYPVISVADHISAPQPHPHCWVTATAFAMATEKIRVLTAFSNNLFRSPVEFAHAALALQRVSNGRAEAGLGAGWAEPEITGMGWEFPSNRDRAGSYIEAMQIARALLDTGKCMFKGEYYNIDIPLIGPLVEPPPLVASSAGPRTLRGVAPVADRIEIMAFSMTAGPGDVGFLPDVISAYGEDDLKARVDLARTVAPDTPLGFLALVGAGDDPALAARSEAMGDGMFSGFIGPTERVAENLFRLGELGIHRVQIAPSTPDTLSNLAPLLNG
ncbi:MAG: hypothetical protein CMQ49_12125 [Gammaproteobacteria bacterium]|nr:hypothetical protein [Gammaproteobacteria bacterium]